MSWPSGSVNTTNTDASTDSPANARADFLDLQQKVNTIIANGAPVTAANDQTVSGTKTFSSPPVVPTASASGHAMNKGQVEAAIAAATPGSTASNAGLVELATSAETQSGSDATRAVTPAGLAAAMFGGVGQALTDVKASRALGTTYTNTSGRTIYVFVVGYTGNSSGATPYLEGNVDGAQIARSNMGDYNGSNYAGVYASVGFPVPNGSTYSVTAVYQTPTISTWRELR